MQSVFVLCVDSYNLAANIASANAMSMLWLVGQHCSIKLCHYCTLFAVMVSRNKHNKCQQLYLLSLFLTFQADATDVEACRSNIARARSERWSNQSIVRAIGDADDDGNPKTYRSLLHRARKQNCKFVFQQAYFILFLLSQAPFLLANVVD